jgi:hypothetical protein
VPVLLFGGLLSLRIGQLIWIAVIMASYIRVTLVVARREELLDELHLTPEINERAAWYHARAHLVVAPIGRLRDAHVLRKANVTLFRLTQATSQSAAG